MAVLRRSGLWTLVAAGLASAALGAWRAWAPAEMDAGAAASARATRFPMRIAYAPGVLNLPLYVALDRGWFAEAGLDIDAIRFTTANDMINALVAGRVDAATGVSAVPVLHLEASAPGRLRVLIHSRMTGGQPFDGLVVPAGSSIRTLGDLAGRRLGAYPGTTATNLVRAFLRRKGVDPTRVTIVQLPPSGQVSALETGAVDALFAYEPTLATTLARGARPLNGSIFADLLAPSPISAAVVSRAFDRGRPEATRRLRAVLDRAVGEIRVHPGAARVSLVRHMQLADDVAARVGIVADTLSSEVDVVNLQAFVDLLVQIGELGTPVSARALVAEEP
jgi:ABC-type nitrate/sulfonate/bicarbonate transport system substrate-binding protein